MGEFISNQPDLATPLNSQGGYGNAYGVRSLSSSLSRKIKSRKHLSQPEGNDNDPESATKGDDATSRYFGSFSLESKRHVWDLLSKHPSFQNEGSVRKNRIYNNTSEILTGDPLKLINNGGHIVYEKP